ncbi:MAG: hypothetical protein IPM60_07065 [Rhodospirillales bacterium]|nr:hypothetical protein [Rhodospirillales bacterium]
MATIVTAFCSIVGGFVPARNYYLIENKRFVSVFRAQMYADVCGCMQSRSQAIEIT